MESIPIGDRTLGKVVPLSGTPEASTSSDEPETIGLETAGLEPGGPDPGGPEPAATQIAWFAEEGLRIGIGFASAVAAALARAFEGLKPTPGVDDELVEGEPAPVGTSPVALAAGAAAGLTVEVATAAIRAAESAAEAALPLLSWFAVPRVLLGPVTTVEERASDLNKKWSRARRPSEEAAAAFARDLIPEVANALLDQIDLTQLVVDRVDVERIVDSVDLGHIIERIPIDQIIARIDLNAVVAGVDINAIVERVDLNEIADRIDLDAIVERIDIVGIAREVIAEVDLPQIIRASSGTMATETVEGIRSQTMVADRLLARAVDRMLLRKKERLTGAPAEVPDGSPVPPEGGR